MGLLIRRTLPRMAERFRVMFMNIGAVSFDPYSSSIGALQRTRGMQNNVPGMSKDGERDSYIAGMSAMAADMAIPTSTYNAKGMMVEDFGPIESAGSAGMSSTANQAMDVLSETFRANEDSIEMTLDALGLSVEDLIDPDNMDSFADAMKKGAASLGVPQVDNLDEAVENAINLIKAASESENSSSEYREDKRSLMYGEYV